MVLNMVFIIPGYVWLARRGPRSGRNSELVISVTPNQDSPLSDGMRPLLVLDVWEHAYYLKHQFRRPKHIEDWWMVVDWDNVEELDNFWADWDQQQKTEL